MVTREAEMRGSVSARPPTTCRIYTFKDVWQEQQRETKRFIVVLSRCINPKTHQTYTYRELAAIFGCSEKTIQSICARKGAYRQPFPEVRHGELPENEKAFFMGLALGGYPINHNRWGLKDGYVVISTESRNEQRKRFLKQTIGTWGEIHENSTKFSIYLNPCQFDFMINPKIDAKFLGAQTRFAPFLLGLLASRLSDRGNRLSLNNEDLLRRIHRLFSTYFGFSLGHFSVEQRISKTRNEDNDCKKRTVSVITVKNPGQVFGALTQVNSVGSLPFLPDLAKPSSRSA
jgi:hypothetical protein